MQPRSRALAIEANSRCAEKFGKRANDYLALPSTRVYIAALEDEESQSHSKEFTCQKIRYVKTSRARLDRGGGAWLHTDLAVHFARCLDVRFAIWCDRQIEALIMKLHPHYDWKRLRHEASSGFKAMNAALKMQRQNQGKEVASHRFSNEDRLIDWVLTGTFDAVNREDLPESDLDRLAKLEAYNTLPIGNGLKYDDRKTALEGFAADGWMPRIAAQDPKRRRLA